MRGPSLDPGGCSVTPISRSATATIGGVPPEGEACAVWRIDWNDAGDEPSTPVTASLPAVPGDDDVATAGATGRGWSAVWISAMRASVDSRLTLPVGSAGPDRF